MIVIGLLIYLTGESLGRGGLINGKAWAGGVVW